MEWVEVLDRQEKNGGVEKGCVRQRVGAGLRYANEPANLHAAGRSNRRNNSNHNNDDDDDDDDDDDYLAVDLCGRSALAFPY